MGDDVVGVAAIEPFSMLMRSKEKGFSCTPFSVGCGSKDSWTSVDDDNEDNAIDGIGSDDDGDDVELTRFAVCAIVF